jgi:hypothetical protein
MHTFGRLLRKKEGWRLLAGTLKEKQKNSPKKFIVDCVTQIGIEFFHGLIGELIVVSRKKMAQ